MSLPRPMASTAEAALAWPPVVLAASRKLRSGLVGQRTLVEYVLSVGAMQATGLVGGALAFRWIDPASMGVWHTLLLASSYLTVVRLGMLNGMGRELPYDLGRGDTLRARRIAATTLSWNIGCSAVVGATFLGLLAFSGAAGRAWRVALPAMALVSAGNLYLSYLQATFRSDREFARLARVHWIQAAGGLAMPVLVYVFGFAGLCAHAALQVAVAAAFAHAWRPWRVRPRFDVGLARELFATGLPLFAASYLQVLALGFDRVVLLHRGGVERVGLYAPAAAVLSAMAIVPGALAAYVYPRMSYALGQGRGNSALRRLALGAGAAAVAIGLPLAVGGWLVAPDLIVRFFPRYAASVPAVRWSLVAGLLWSVTPASSLFSSLKVWRSLWLYIGALVLARGGFPWLLSRGGDVLEGVAKGNACAAACAGALALVLVWRATASAVVEERTSS